MDSRRHLRHEAASSRSSRLRLLPTIFRLGSEPIDLLHNIDDEPELFQLFSRIILLSSISDYVTFYIAYIIYYEYNVY